MSLTVRAADPGWAPAADADVRIRVIATAGVEVGGLTRTVDVHSLP